MTNTKSDAVLNIRINSKKQSSSGTYACSISDESGVELIRYTDDSFGIFFCGGVGNLKLRKSVSSGMRAEFADYVKQNYNLPRAELSRWISCNYPQKKNQKIPGSSVTLLSFSGSELSWSSAGLNALYLKRNNTLYRINSYQSDRAENASRYAAKDIGFQEVMGLSVKEHSFRYVSAVSGEECWEESAVPFSLMEGDFVVLCTNEITDVISEDEMCVLIGNNVRKSAKKILSIAKDRLCKDLYDVSVAVVYCKNIGVGNAELIECQTVRSNGFSETGGRIGNEDHILCLDNVWAVADGLGGHSDGEIASGIAVDRIRTIVSEDYNPSVEWKKSALTRINEEILNDIMHPGMRTTLTAAFLKNNVLSYISIGDCRLYHIRNGRIIQLTKDDSLGEALQRSGQYKGDLRTSEHQNKLRRVLGSSSGGIPREENIREIPVVAGDGFVMCSDGFWEYIYDEEIMLDFYASTTPYEWTERMLRRVLCRTSCTSDNLSAITVMLR